MTAVIRDIDCFDNESQSFKSLGMVDSMTTNVDYDEYCCVGSPAQRIPREVTTDITIILEASTPPKLFSGDIQRFKIGTTELYCLIKRWDFRITGFDTRLYIEAVITETTDNFDTEVALADCLDTMEFNEDLL